MTIRSVFIGACALIALTPAAYGQSWDNSPNNWKNSPNNWQNSPSNWRNSPNNYENSQRNYGSNNGIYGTDGSRKGYAVPRADGSGVNLFDNSGNLEGYHNY